MEFFTEKLADNMFGKKLVGDKKNAWQKQNSGENFVTCKKFCYFSSSFFFKIRYIKKFYLLENDFFL